MRKSLDLRPEQRQQGRIHVAYVDMLTALELVQRSHCSIKHRRIRRARPQLFANDVAKLPPSASDGDDSADSVGILSRSKRDECAFAVTKHPEA